MTRRQRLERTILAVTVSSLAFCSIANAQQEGAAQAASAAKPVVIHVHHHYYYGPPAEASLDMLQSNPLATGFHPWLGHVVNAQNLNYGDLGLYGYVGQIGQNSGLIVSRVTPGSPASKMKLVPGDMILSVNDTDLSQVSLRQLEGVFAGLQLKQKNQVKMRIFNTFTRRYENLAAELVEDQPKK